MATEVLYPQDVLSKRWRIPHASVQRRKNVPTNLNVNRRSGSNTTNRKTSPKPEKKKVEEKKGIQGPKGDGAAPAPAPAPAQVILLRRGESLDSLTAKIKSANPKPKSPKRKSFEGPAVLANGSEPEKPVYSSPPPPPPRYAGSAAFALSPSPQSLPLPSFFNKKQENSERFDDSATRDLRRLLRLD